MILKQKTLLICAILVFLGALVFGYFEIFTKSPTIKASKKPDGMVLGAEIDARGPKQEKKVVSLSIELPPDLPEKIKAKSYLVFYLNSGEVISEKKSHSKLPIASLTKLMTGFVAYNALNFKEYAQVDPKYFWQVSPKLNLKANDSVLIQDLFDSMIIGSANDAAFALAQVYENSTEKNFVKQMNEQALALGMSNTSFSNPAGFDSLQNFSTASDLKILISNVFKIPAFKNLARKNSYSFSSKEGKSYIISATNKLLLKYQDILAIKTGYTKESLGSMATVLETDMGQIVLIVLDSNQREKDTLLLRQLVLDSSLK